MAVDAVQTNNRTNQASYIKSATVGALSGFALKHILPLTKEEKDAQLSLKLDTEKKAREAKLAEIKVIEKNKANIEGADVFIKNLQEPGGINAWKVKALEEPKKSQVLALVSRVNDKAREVKAEGRKIVTAIKKYLRPTKTFVAAGAGVALAVAFVYNVLGKMQEE